MSVLDFAIGVFTSLVLAGAAIGAPAPHRFFDSEGVRIHYIDTGGADGADGAGADASDREPVVLIHGFSRDLELTWVEPGLVDALDDSYRVIALDCRGHGKSDCPRDDEDDAYGAHMIEDVGRLLDHLEIDRAHLVGYSMGGRMALKLAALKPRRARSVVLIGAGGARPQDDHRLWDHLAAALEAGEGIMPLLRTILPELPEDELRAINDQTLSRNDAPALAAVARHYRAFATSEEQLRAIRAPVLAVIGSNDAFRGDVDALARSLPDLKVEVIDRANHVTTLLHPQLLGSVTAFLTDASREQPQED